MKHCTTKIACITKNASCNSVPHKQAVKLGVLSGLLKSDILREDPGDSFTYMANLQKQSEIIFIREREPSMNTN